MSAFVKVSSWRDCCHLLTHDTPNEVHFALTRGCLLCNGDNRQVRGLVLAASKLFITTVLFVLLVFLSEIRFVATGMCGALLGAAAACSARSVSGGGSADGQASTGGSGGQQGDEEAELVEKR